MLCTGALTSQPMFHSQPLSPRLRHAGEMPMPACATAERAVFSCIDQNKETDQKKTKTAKRFLR